METKLVEARKKNGEKPHFDRRRYTGSKGSKMKVFSPFSGLARLAKPLYGIKRAPSRKKASCLSVCLSACFCPPQPSKIWSEIRGEVFLDLKIPQF